MVEAKQHAQLRQHLEQRVQEYIQQYHNYFETQNKQSAVKKVCVCVVCVRVVCGRCVFKLFVCCFFLLLSSSALFLLLLFCSPLSLCLALLLRPSAISLVLLLLSTLFLHSLTLTHSQTELDPLPRVLLIEDIGLITIGNTYKDCVIAADIYEHTITTIKGN